MSALSPVDKASVLMSEYRVSPWGNVSETCTVGVQAASLAPSRSCASFVGLIGHRGSRPALNVLLHLTHPLNLQIEQEDDDGFIVSDTLFGIYGEGDDPIAAFQDYRSALIDYFFLLHGRRKSSRENAHLYDAVSRHIEAVSPRPHHYGSSTSSVRLPLIRIHQCR